MYDHDWNLNRTVTKSLVIKRHNNDAVSNSVTSFPVRGPNILNFRDQQERSLNYYSEMYLEDQLKFQEFMRQDNNIPNTLLVASKEPSRRFRKSPDRLIHNQPIDFNVRAKTKPSSYIFYTNNSSISVLTTDPKSNKTIVQATINDRTTKKNKKNII